MLNMRFHLKPTRCDHSILPLVTRTHEHLHAGPLNVANIPLFISCFS